MSTTSGDSADPQKDSAQPPVEKGWLNSILSLGLKEAPAVTRIAIGALVIFAVAITIINFAKGVPFEKVLLVAIAILIIGVIAALVAKAVSGRRLGLLGDLLAWAFVLAFITAGGIALSALLLGSPRSAVVVMAELTNTPGLAARDPTAANTVLSVEPLSGIDAVYRTPPDGSNPAERVSKLSEYPALRLNHGSLVTEAGDNSYLVASRLELIDSEIRTNGAQITIEVNELVVNNGRIEAFAPSPAGPPPYGQSGGRVTIIVHDRVSGSPLNIDLSGYAGSPGENGAQGGVGAQGAAGDNAASGLVDCSRGAGNGQPGHQGGTGGDGLAGGKGGDGGNLFLGGNIDTNAVSFKSVGGPAGKGGAAGIGGPGGPGGPGGSARGLCSGGGNGGPAGPQGDPGHRGADGASGATGSLSRIA